MSCLARNVLAIQITSVASESAFSIGGRVLDDFRTSLTPFMVEAIVCTQDWLRRTIPINIEENTEELAKLEEELIKEFRDKAKIDGKASESSKARLGCLASLPPNLPTNPRPAVYFLNYMVRIAWL